MLRLTAALVLGLAVVSPCLAQEAETIEYRPNVEYGTGGGQKLTLHLGLPKKDGPPRGMIFVIHGGGWAGGNKDVHVPQVKELANAGYVAASVGYRLVKADVPDTRFPAQVEDVKCAVRWARAHARELNVDPNRFGAIGFSAGAHLSMMLGVMDREDGLEGTGGWADQSSKVQAVVAYFGPTNFLLEYPDASKKIVANFLGGSKEEKADDYKKASPITYVNEGDAPTLIFQGTKDVLVPYEQGWVMAQALTDAKVPGRVELLLGANHGWGGPELERTRRESWAFFNQYLQAPQP